MLPGNRNVTHGNGSNQLPIPQPGTSYSINATGPTLETSSRWKQTYGNIKEVGGRPAQRQGSESESLFRKPYPLSPRRFTTANTGFLQRLENHSHNHFNAGPSSSLSSSSSYSGSDTLATDADEDEIIVLADEGRQKLFPQEPELSCEFKEYLSLLSRDPQKIAAVAKNPPISMGNCSSPQNESSCYIMPEDLSEIQTEIRKIVESWPKEKQDELTRKDTPTIQLLSLHECLMCLVLAAKERCINQALSTEIIDRTTQSNLSDLGYNLLWQFGVFKDMYHQTLVTPYMLEEVIKRKNKEREGAKPTLSTSKPLPSSTKSKKQKSSVKRSAASPKSKSTPKKK